MEDMTKDELIDRIQELEGKIEDLEGKNEELEKCLKEVMYKSYDIIGDIKYAMM